MRILIFLEVIERQVFSEIAKWSTLTQAISDMGPFGRRVRALGILINAELDLMKDTLPIEYHTTVLDIIVAPGNNFWKDHYSL